MIGALALAFGDLLEPRIRGVVVQVAALTALAFAVVGALLWWAVGGIDPLDPALGVDLWLFTVPPGWIADALVWVVNGILGIFGILLFVALLWLGFVVIAQNVASLFLDRVIEAVEARHYPGLPPTSQTFRQAIAAGFNLTAMVIGVNILALPAYLVLAFVPPANLVLFVVINGYLFGREYFEAVVFRREQGPAAEARWRARRGTWVVAGMIIAGLMSVPVVNLVAPIVGAAFMTHLHNRAAAR
jgi:uncharacterized protein involved in cysteine biosynthesis